MTKSKHRITIETYVNQYRAQIAAGIDVEWARKELADWQRMLDAETAREAESQLDAALASRAPETATPASPASAPEPRSHLSRLDQLTAMEAENGPGSLAYDLAQAERTIIARSPHLANNPTALRSLAISTLKLEEQWNASRQEAAGPDTSKMTLEELRTSVFGKPVTAADIAAEQAAYMKAREAQYEENRKADAARETARAKAERVEQMAAALRSQGLTDGQAREQLAKAGYDGSAPVTKPQVGTAIREAFEKGL